MCAGLLAAFLPKWFLRPTTRSMSRRLRSNFVLSSDLAAEGWRRRRTLYNREHRRDDRVVGEILVRRICRGNTHHQIIGALNRPPVGPQILLRAPSFQRKWKWLADPDRTLEKPYRARDVFGSSVKNFPIHPQHLARIHLLGAVTDTPLRDGRVVLKCKSTHGNIKKDAPTSARGVVMRIGTICSAGCSGS